MVKEKLCFFFSTCISACLLLALATVSSLAQEPTAQITGLVSDPSGASIPGAALDVQNTATGVHAKTTSNASGNYVLANLAPGPYRITATKDGFEKVERTGITLTVSQTARLDFSLKVGSTSETVEVNSTAPLLQSSSASINQVIDSKTVVDLPLNGRNFLQLAKLSAGVLNPKPGDRAAAGGSFVANGVRAQLNNFQLDGIDNNAKIVDQQNSSPVTIQPSVDALQEFTVETNNFSAEYGYSAGAVVNATIKSGTNKIHGDAFEFIRNDFLDARDYFADPNQRKPLLRRNQFGATLGGPIVRNKAFFFGSWEQTRQASGATFVETVPTAAEKAGDFSAAGLPPLYDPSTTQQVGNTTNYTRTAFAGNRIPSGRIDPLAAKLLALEPLPTVANSAVNNFVSNPTDTSRVNRFDARQDTYLSDLDQLFVRYSYDRSNSATPGPFPPPLIGSSTFQQANQFDAGHGVALGETHVFKPNLVNEFRAGYNRIEDNLTPFVTDNLISQFGFQGIPQQPGVTGLPQLSVTGFAGLGEATYLPNYKISEALIIEDHVAWTLGRHSIKIGGEYRWVRSWFDIGSSARGSFSFTGAFSQNPLKRSGSGSGMADVLLGIPASATLSNLTTGDLRYKNWGAYIQDDWKVTSKLTLNLGLRYELWTPPVERNNNQANFLPELNQLVYADNNVPPGIPAGIVANVPNYIGSRSLIKPDYNNAAPRVGFAYQATASTVLRAGAGLFYADNPAIGASARLPGNPPFSNSNSFQTNNLTPLLTLSGGFPANTLSRNINLSTAGLSAFAENFPQGNVYHWSFGLQQQVKQYVVEANYVGTKGTDLPLTYNLNQPFAGPGSVASRRPLGGFNDITYTIPMDGSVYHALEARVERRFASGFSLLASYTFSKSIDFGGEQLIGDLSLRDARNVKAERGLSLADQRHRLVASAVYELPLGKGKRFEISNAVLNAVAGNWQINGIFSAFTGQPFTPSNSVSSANTGAARPDRIADGNLPRDQRTVNHWFDTAAFVSPTPYDFGNAGRDILIAPGAANLDFSVFKQFPVTKLGEAGRVQVRGEFFNFLNHPQFGRPNANIDVPQAGTITSLATSMREVQLSVKVLF